MQQLMEVCTAGDEGYVITTTDKDGFGGNIRSQLVLRKTEPSMVLSILSISETAGLGMKAGKSLHSIIKYVNKKS